MLVEVTSHSGLARARMISLTIGSATTILVVTEFALTLLLTAATSIVINLRAHCKLYSTGYLDFSEIAWTVRSLFHFRPLLIRPYLFFLKALRIAGPFILLVAFVFIGASIEQKIDFENYEEKQVKAYGKHNGYWDTLGRERSVTDGFIENALRKGEWKGLPSNEVIPVADTEFNRLKWREQRGQYKYECRLEKSDTGEYAFSRFYETKSLLTGINAIDSSVERVRKVGESDYAERWITMPYRVRARTVNVSNLSGNASEELFSGISKDHSTFPYYGSGAAFRLCYEREGVEYCPLTDYKYVNLLHNPEGDLEECKRLSQANVIVEFVGI